MQCIAKNRDGSRCTKRTLTHELCAAHLRSLHGLEVRESRIPGAGKGLFYVGKTPLPAGHRLTEYSAPRVSSTPDPTSDYVLEVSAGRYLDSRDPLNAAGRYINDRRGTGLRANTRFTRGARIYRRNGRYYVPIFTTATVQPGAELLIRYGRTYFH